MNWPHKGHPHTEAWLFKIEGGQIPIHFEGKQERQGRGAFVTQSKD